MVRKWNPEKTRTLLCAFLLPCILLITVFAAIGIYPFGEKSLLIIDMNSEYVDYFAQMNESVRTGGSLLRSWNMGMGLNMLGLIAFYASSPFNLLVLLFPVEWITEVLFAVTVLKIGLAGLLFALYTDYVFERRGLFAVAFSVAYALCAYNVAYASNIMWLDGAAFLPLVLLGVEKLLREGRRNILLFSFAYVFFSSYYIGYMIGVFSLLYLTTVWFAQPRPAREYVGKLLRFVGTALLAAGCCTILLLPAFLNLQQGQSELFMLDLSFALKKPLIRILTRMLPGVYDTLTDAGYPNIYCTVLGLLLCVLFFLHRGIARRRKLVFSGLLFFLLLSFSCRAIYLAWHAFEDPTWFPARYSFVFCFLVLYLAMHVAKRPDELSGNAVAGAVVLLLVLLMEMRAGYSRYVDKESLLAGGALIVAYGAMWLLWKRKGYRWLASVALVLVCMEAWGNTLVMAQGLDEQFQYRTRASYSEFRERYGPVIRELERQDPSVYRMELVEQRNANGGMALGYNGISHYSTTTDQPLNALLRRLGYNKGTSNELRFTQSTPLTNGLLGIKYVLSDRDLGNGYQLRHSVGNLGVYENSCAFPLAFWADTAALEFRGNAEDPFALQNDWLHALGQGNAFFTPAADVEYTLYNVDREQQEEGWLLFTPRVRDDSAAVDYRVHNAERLETYAFFPVWKNQFARADILVNGELVQRDLRYRGNTIVPMSNDESITLTLELGQSVASIREEYVYRLDLAAAMAAAAAANEHAMEFERFTDTLVEGKLTAPRDGALVTTFPMDSGWSIWVDGRRTAPQTFADVFLAVPVGEGEHSITMRYSSPGFVVGSWISAGCLAGIAAYWFWRKRRRATGKAPDTA